MFLTDTILFTEPTWLISPAFLYAQASASPIDYIRSKSTAFFLRLLVLLSQESVIGLLLFRIYIYIHDLLAALGASASLFADDAPTIPIRPPSLLPFFRLGLVGGMTHTNQADQVVMHHCWEPPSPF